MSCKTAFGAPLVHVYLTPLQVATDTIRFET